MIREIEDFQNIWKYESESTMKLFALLNEATFNTVVHPKIRTLKNLAWHIASTPIEMLKHAGLPMSGLNHEDEAPLNPQGIIDAYEIAIAQVNLNVPKWSNTDLLDKVNMYGENWSKGTVLDVLIKHQAHHRGELVMLMRLQNLPVIGVYGPTFEEWKQIGMEPQV